MLKRPTNPRRFLTADETVALEAAIARAERATSGQIKIVLARHCWLGLRRKARILFGTLGLDRTTRRNCAMVLLVTSNRQFLIYGDRGIHQHVGRGFWEEVGSVLRDEFRQGRFAEGLVHAIERIGQQLAEHFPREEAGDELSNRIEYAA